MERESKYNYYVSSNNDNTYSNHFVYSKKNHTFAEKTKNKE